MVNAVICGKKIKCTRYGETNLLLLSVCLFVLFWPYLLSTVNVVLVNYIVAIMSRWGIDELLAISCRWGIDDVISNRQGSDELLDISCRWVLINYLLSAVDLVLMNISCHYYQQ